MRERRGSGGWARGLQALVPLILVAPAFAARESQPSPPVVAGAAASSNSRPAADAAEPRTHQTDLPRLDHDAPDKTPVTPPADAAAVPAEPTPPAATKSPAAPPVRAAQPVAPGLPPGPDVPAAVDSAASALPSPDATSATDTLDPEELVGLAHQDAATLGPLSIGTPDAGLLVNPQPMPEGPLWTIRNPVETWGTQETIDFVAAAIEAVHTRFPDSPRVVIGDISRPDGGRLNRHKSHQAGRDVDIGFYYDSGDAGDFRTVRARAGSAPQLDLPRTWALVRAFLTETDVDRIFVDRSLIAVFYRYARFQGGEDPAWLDDVFGRGERKGIIQHERRHKDHMHVRFYNRVAQEKGRIVYAALVEDGVVGPPTVKHVARRGETLGHLARRYGTSVSAIKTANGLRGTRIRAGRAYLIPVRRVKSDDAPIVVPPRRLPPPVAAHAAPAPAAGPAPPAPPPPSNEGTARVAPSDRGSN
jgi:murein endopeptidase